MNKGTIYGLYCVCHIDAGPRYIGLTRNDPQARLREHLKPSWLEKSAYPVSRWVLKHGRENIRMYPLEECSISRLSDREVYWISEFKARGAALLNLSPGGAGDPTSPSIEVRESISRKLKEYYSNHDNPFKGKKHSEETRLKMSQAAMGRTLSPEARAKVAASSKGRVKSASTLAKMSVNNTGEGNPSAKIDREAATEIWTRLQTSTSATPIADISKDLGISRHIVSNIKNGLSWGHVTGLENPYGRVS